MINDRQYLKNCRYCFSEGGFAIVNEVLSEGSAFRLADRCLKMSLKGLVLRTDKITEPNIDLLDGGGIHKYSIISGSRIILDFPELICIYESVRYLLSYITGYDLRTSPYGESAINVMVYDREGDECAYHFDSNPVTAILYLTRNTKGGSTNLKMSTHDIGEAVTRRPWSIEPKPGTMLVFPGRECWHSSAPVVKDEPKVAVTLNYYRQNDVMRPLRMDEHSYGIKKEWLPDLIMASRGN